MEEQLLSEGLIYLSEAAALARVTPQAVKRWAVDGKMVKGELVHLEVMRLGGKGMMTSVKAPARFSQRLRGKGTPTQRKRLKQVKEARAFLAAVLKS